MKEMLIVSGKGGTGKTSITAAISSIVKNSVFADCDVDAADLHLVLNPKVIKEYEFISGHQAIIRQDDCVACSICLENCRFNAINNKDGKYSVDPIACEGCGVCTWMCPQRAIDFKESLCGHYYVSDTRFGKLVHAKLAVAAENSGKLVSVVRNKAREIATDAKCDYVIIDGPPGIGCPVIASMTGVNSAIIITEPSLSGLHDMERIINLANHFSIDTYVCINKYDINLQVTKQIKEMIANQNIPLIGQIPYDKDITSAQINEQTIIEYSNSATSKAIKEMWQTYKKVTE